MRKETNFLCFRLYYLYLENPISTENVMLKGINQSQKNTHYDSICAKFSEKENPQKTKQLVVTTEWVEKAMGIAFLSGMMNMF